MQPQTSSEVVNAMSIDVEDYFHVSAFDGVIPRYRWPELESRVSANTDRLLSVLEEHGVRCTCFVLGWVADRFPALVRRITSGGHEVASHGFAHRLIYDQTHAAFREDVRRAKRLLEDCCGQPVVGYRAPSYSITARSLWALDVLVEEGYQYDSSIFPIRHDRYGIPLSSRLPYGIERSAGTLIEVPGSTARVGMLNVPIGGGGYFRILPYAITRWGIQRVNRVDQMPAVFYLHPWEIDPDQPRMRAGYLSRFRHYRNLDRTLGRLRALLTDFRFDTMASLLKRISVKSSIGHTNEMALPYVW